jgi:hypothetical protein
VPQVQLEPAGHGLFRDPRLTVGYPRTAYRVHAIRKEVEVRRWGFVTGAALLVLDLDGRRFGQPEFLRHDRDRVSARARVPALARGRIDGHVQAGVPRP